MTPELLQTYSIPIGVALAIVIMVAVGPLRNAITASFKQGRKGGENARRTLTRTEAPPSTEKAPAPPASPQSFGRRR